MERSKLKSLLAELTLDEKIGQLVQLSGEFYNASDISLGPQRKLGITQRTVDLSGSVLNVVGAENIRAVQKDHLQKSKHAIPLLFMADIVYGYRTIYPIPIGMGSSWNPELIQKAYKNTAEEAYAGGVHVTFAPMVDLVRDPRWGRTLESTGEDPYLNSQFAKAMVNGFQFGLNEGKGIASCVKHFAAYGAAEAGREYNSADMSLVNLYQNYLPAYKAAVKAGAKMVMTSLSTLNGVPSTADRWLIQDVLRKQWGFEGVVISDYASVFELIQHGFAKDAVDAAGKALQAGVDIDMKSPCYAQGLQPLLEDGKLSIDKIDDAVWRVLTLKNNLGLFENPYRGASSELEKTTILTESKRKAARQVSRESLVLLKNDNDILPLNIKDNKSVALIGPYSSEKELLGLWAVHGDRQATVTFEDGIREYLGEKLNVAKGTDIIRDVAFFDQSGMIPGLAKKVISSDEIESDNFKSALATANEADIIIFTCGEHTMQSGEAGSRTKLRLPENQMRLFNALVQTNKPIITVVVSGRPLILSEVAEKSQALIQAWFPGTEGGHALADIIFGKTNPSGRLSMSMPFNEGQLPMSYNYLSTGRPERTSQHVGRFVSRYIDAPTKPLYSFGYGLSYGKVRYHDLQCVNNIQKSGFLEVSIKIDNVGKYDRDEVVQVYIHDIEASIVQPIRRLIDFKKVHIRTGESRAVNFLIDKNKLGFYDQQGNFRVEPGRFKLFVGKSSEDTLEENFVF